MGFPIGTDTKIAGLRIHSDLVDSDRVDAVRFSAGADLGTPSSPVAVAPVQFTIGRWSRWIAVVGGCGCVPIAPGTAGSLAGVVLFLLFVNAANALSRANLIALYPLGVASLLILGVRAAGRAEVDFGRRDDSRSVIDEVVGQLISLMPLTLPVALRLTRPLEGGDFFLLFLDVVTGFVLFRLFDVWKPGAIRWAERRFEGGLGVMADDVVAGCYACVCLGVLHLFVFERFLSAPAAAVSSSIAA